MLVDEVLRDALVLLAEVRGDLIHDLLDGRLRLQGLRRVVLEDVGHVLEELGADAAVAHSVAHLL